MTKLLVVKGHPLTADYSMSLKGLDAFVAAYKAAHPTDEIEVLDVFDGTIPSLNTELVSAMFAGEGAQLTASQQEKLARFGELTEQFLAADKVVIANPMYNLMIPAELKSWVDTVNVAGKTFKYTAEGPVGLAGGKKVLHLQANGEFMAHKIQRPFICLQSLTSSELISSKLLLKGMLMILIKQMPYLLNLSLKLKQQLKLSNKKALLRELFYFYPKKVTDGLVSNF